MEEVSRETKISVIRNWLSTGSINLFGLPFSGKDTQGKKLASVLSAVLIGGGDILRSSLSTPQHVRDEIDQGKMAPTEEYKRIVLPYFKKAEFAGKPLILSSVGRWAGEEKPVVESAEQSGHPIKVAVHFLISEDIMRKRWKAAHELMDRGNRVDDREEKLDTRLSEFRSKAKPVIEFYEKNGLLIKIGGKPSPDIVFNKLIDLLYEKAS